MSPIIAYIPARGGSKRIPGKNVKPLGGHPLMAYTISAAIDAGIFRGVYVSTDSLEAMEVARDYGAKVIIRPADISGDGATDYEWLSHAIGEVGDSHFFALLRPTAPFRMAETIRRAWRTIEQDPLADSLRAVEPVRQHPGKMWIVAPGARYMEPLMNYPSVYCCNAPYNSPTQALPPVWVQNASLEIGKTRNVDICHNVSGQKIIPFYTQNYEGFDLNTPEDWLLAERLIELGVALPEARKAQ